MNKSIKAIYLARHGETTGNRADKILGQSDFPLTEKGIESSKKLTQLLSREKIDLIISSPLGRAFSTAKIIGEKLDKSVTITPLLAELSSGLWEGKYRNEVLPPGKPLRGTWDKKPPGGESFHDREEDLHILIKEINKLTEDKILIVGHGGINQLLLKIWFDLENKPKKFPLQPNNVIYILENNKTRWIDSNGNKGNGWWKP